MVNTILGGNQLGGGGGEEDSLWSQENRTKVEGIETFFSGHGIGRVVFEQPGRDSKE